MNLVERLLQIDVSALSDADKALPVTEPALRAMIPDVRMAGPAFTVLAEDDHLPVMAGLAQAAPGDVLVIATGGSTRAVFGELFATEARRRGLAGIVADGFCRDLRGLREIRLPVFARGTTPRSGSTVSRAASGATIAVGGVEVSPGDIVFGDDDGLSDRDRGADRGSARDGGTDRPRRARDPRGAGRRRGAPRPHEPR